MSDQYAAITAHWGQFPVRLMCGALDVSLSGYDAAKARVAQGPSARAQADERLLVTIRTTFAKSRGRYGAHAAGVRVHDGFRPRQPHCAESAGATLRAGGPSGADSGVGRGYDLYPHAVRLAVSGGADRSRDARDRGLGHECVDGHRAAADGAAAGGCASTAGAGVCA